MSTSEVWIPAPVRKFSRACERPTPLTAEETKQVIKKALAGWHFESVVTYGSINGTFRDTSDVDLMIFSKTLFHRDDLLELKKEISNYTLRKVDLVFMLIQKKAKKPNDRDQVFFDEVYDSGQVLIGSNFRDYMITSRKIGKV